MDSFMEMSLEDIIRKKKGQNTRSKGKLTGNPPLKQMPPKKLPIVDARNRIISKNRTQITDARDKLAQLAKQKDARLKLQQLRMKRQAVLQQTHTIVLPSRGMYLRNMPTRGRVLTKNERIFMDTTREVVSRPLTRDRIAGRLLTRPKQLNTKRFLENRSIESRSFDARAKLRAKPKPILRTVENNLEVMDDPMDNDDGIVLPKQSSINRKANLQLRIVARNDSVMRENRSASRGRRLATPERVSPPRPPSILKKRPMASLHADKLSEKPEKPVLEYRIIVSNLRNTVTAGDIQELFGDVGGMLESRLVRSGTAEVLYKTMEDAQRAVELYHNRQLDGQPMNCLLVTPRPIVAASRLGNKPALMSTSSNVEPDISTFHKVLFSKF